MKYYLSSESGTEATMSIQTWVIQNVMKCYPAYTMFIGRWCYK